MDKWMDEKIPSECSFFAHSKQRNTLLCHKEMNVHLLFSQGMEYIILRYKVDSYFFVHPK